ncbi:Perilipin-2 [Halotydeus destructor]|nr:Perilipin-2 [Halotydeus destructor]
MVSEVSTSNVQLESVSRVYELPLVKSTIAAATEQYEKLKSNPIVGPSITKAEQTVSYVATNAAMPVVSKFEGPLKLADSLVCQGLDKLEENVPAIKKSPEEIKSATFEKYEELKGAGVSKVENLKTFGYDKVNDVLGGQYSLAVMKSLDSAMDFTENAVDHYFPAAEGEPINTTGNDENNVVQRMSNLTEKMRIRMFKQAMTQVDVLKKRSSEALDTMKHSVDLIAYARSLEESGKEKIFSGAGAVQQNAKWLWEELNKEEPVNAEDQPKGVDQEILSVARRATKEVINRYNQLVEALPVDVQQTVSRGRDHLSEVYTKLTNSSSLKDVTDLALQEMFTAVEFVRVLVSPNAQPAIDSAEPTPAEESDEPEPEPDMEMSEIRNVEHNHSGY